MMKTMKTDTTQVPLTERTDSWIGWHCMVAPRVLIWGAPGIGTTVLDRTYSPAEIEEVAGTRLAVEVESFDGWIVYVRWLALELFPEYERRNGKQHKNQARVAHIRRNIRPTDFLPQYGEVWL